VLGATDVRSSSVPGRVRRHARRAIFTMPVVFIDYESQARMSPARTEHIRGTRQLRPVCYKKYNVADSCHCEGVRPEAIFHQ
jgi:hypothetical protein